MTDDFYVDTTELRAGANRWGDIAEILGEVKLSLWGLSPSTYGDSAFLKKNGVNFRDKWTDGLRILEEKCDGTTTSLRDMADDYDGADADVASTLKYED